MAQLPTVHIDAPPGMAADLEVCLRMRKFTSFGARGIGMRLLWLTCLGVFASPGIAAAHVCQPPSPVSPFAQWGDTNGYFLAPGGSFDGGTSGWTLNGAALGSSSSGFVFGSLSATRSLTISAGASATSPSLCVNRTMPSIRFFARELTAGSALEVQGVVPGAGSPAMTVTITQVPDGSMAVWGPVSPVVLLTASLPAGASVNGVLRFSVPGAVGAWQIDDIYVDPYRVS
jgi:hypothetical protein